MPDGFETQFRPQQVGERVFIAPNATVLGDVQIGDDCSIWFNAVIRGDTETIRIGKATNIQDGAILHADAGVPCTLGDNVTVGHAAIVHGATLEDNVMIGMRAVVLNAAKIGAGSIVGAGALVTEGTVIPPGSLVLGMPAKVVRQTTAEQQDRLVKTAEHYVRAGRAFSQAALDNGNPPANWLV